MWIYRAMDPNIRYIKVYVPSEITHLELESYDWRIASINAGRPGHPRQSWPVPHSVDVNVGMTLAAVRTIDVDI